MTNWEEYRGFFVTGDESEYPFDPIQYERMDPFHKNVFVALSPRLEQDIVNVMPAWFELLFHPAFDSTETWQYFDIRFTEMDLPIFKRYWTGLKYQVSTNRVGASFEYFGYRLFPTSTPIRSILNAVTFWEGDYNNPNPDSDINSMRDSLNPSLGRTYSWQDRRFDYKVPNTVTRIVIDQRAVADYETTSYYINHPENWSNDYSDMLKYVVTHEFAHSIGGRHNTQSLTIMYEEAPIKNFEPDKGEFFFDPLWINNFNSADKDSLTVNRRSNND